MSEDNKPDDEPEPFSPKQERWISERIDAALAREKGYLDRVGQASKTIAIWFGGLLATGAIGFAALNLISTQLHWRSASNLYSEFSTRHTEKLAEADRKITEYISDANKKIDAQDENLAKIKTDLATTRSSIMDINQKANSDFQDFEENLSNKSADLASKLVRADESLRQADGFHDDIVGILASLRMYDVI